MFGKENYRSTRNLKLKLIIFNEKFASSINRFLFDNWCQYFSVFSDHLERMYMRFGSLAL